MAGIGSSIIAGNVSINGASTATIYHIYCATAGSEYSQVLQDGTIKFSVQSLNNANLKCAFQAGGTNTNFWPVKAGNTWSEDGLSLSGKTLYFQSDINNDTVVILEWR